MAAYENVFSPTDLLKRFAYKSVLSPLFPFNVLNFSSPLLSPLLLSYLLSLLPLIHTSFSLLLHSFLSLEIPSSGGLAGDERWAVTAAD